MELYPFQKDGVDFLAQHKTAFLADEMGLGKSPQAIRAADAVGAKTVLVVCPKTVLRHWENEWHKWQTVSRPIKYHLTFQGSAVIVVNYDKLSGKDSPWPRELSKIEWDVVIFDEAHALKNRGSTRTKAAYGFQPFGTSSVILKAKRVWLLSGTPAPNHAGELWSHLHTLHPMNIDPKTKDPNRELRVEDKFLEAYTHRRPTGWGMQVTMQVTGSKNMKTLRDKYLTGWMLRRRKKEVLKDMPALTFVTEPLTLSGASAIASTDLEVAAGKLEKMFATRFDEDEALAELRASSIVLSTQLRNLGLAKVPFAVDYILDNFPNRPVLVYAWHKDVIRALGDRLAALNPLVITGDTSAENRFEVVDGFQAGDSKLFIGQIAAAGEGINLTAASDVVFVESYWTPAKIHQAACRAHRIGQTRPVVARMLTVPGTVDDKIQRALVRKANQLTELFG